MGGAGGQVRSGESPFGGGVSDSLPLSVSNVSLWLETSEAKDFKLPTAFVYSWPRLTSSKVLVFPLTALGNQTFLDIPVTNPTNAPLFVQALLAADYGPLWSQFVQGNGVGGNLTEGKAGQSRELWISPPAQASLV